PAGSPIPVLTSSVLGHDEAGPAREMDLHPGGLALPLPRGERFRLRVGKVRDVKGVKEVSIDVSKASIPARRLWSGPPTELSGRILDFESAGPGAARLVFQATPTASATAPEDSSAVLEIFPLEVGQAPVRHSGLPDIFLYVIDT